MRKGRRVEDGDRASRRREGLDSWFRMLMVQIFRKLYGSEYFAVIEPGLLSQGRRGIFEPCQGVYNSVQEMPKIET